MKVLAKSFYIRSVLAFSAIFLFIACNNNLIQKVQEDVLLTRLPQIVSTTPAASIRDVDVTADVKIYFSEAMNEASVTSSSNVYVMDILSNAITGTLSYTATGNVLTFTPDDYFEEGRDYYVTIKKDVTNLAGLPIAADYTFEFRTSLKGFPTGSVLVNNGDLYTNTETVELNLTRSANVDLINISNLSDFTSGTGWVAFPNETNKHSFTIDSTADGLKTVYVKFRDIFMQISDAYTATITLDREPAEVPVISGMTATSNIYPTWTWNLVGDAVAYQYKIEKVAGAVLVKDWTSTTALEATSDIALPGEDEDYIFYLKSVDRAGNLSEAATFTTTIDTSQPAEPVITVLAPFTNNVQPTWSWADVPEAVEYRYKLNDSNLDSGATPITSTSYTPASPLSDGSYILYVQAKNANGVWSASGMRNLTIDTVAPTISTFTIDDGADYTHSENVLLSVSSDANSMRFRNLDGSWSEWGAAVSSANWTLESGDGTKTVEIQARDLAGNTASSSATISLDTTAPLVPEISLGAQYSTSATVTASLSIAAEVIEMEVYTTDESSSGWIPAAASHSLTFVSDGVKVVSIRVRDAAGNASEWVSANIVIDTVNPAVSAFSIGSGNPTYTKTAAITLYMTASDATSGVDTMSFSTDGTTYSAWEVYSTSKAYTLTGLDGTKTVYVRVQDKAGRISSVVSDAIILDRTAPSLSVSNNYSGTHMSYLGSGTYTFTASVVNSGDGSQTGIDKVEFYKDTASSGLTNLVATDTASPFTWAWNTISDAEGSYYIKARVYDLAGNVSTTSINTRYLDKTAPAVTTVRINGVNGAAHYTTNRTVAITFSYSGSPVEMKYATYYYSGGWVSEGSTTYKTIVSPDSLTFADVQGLRGLYVYTRDLAGNVSSTSTDAWATITLDSVPPNAPTISSGPADKAKLVTSSETWIWTGGGGGNGIFRYYLGTSSSTQPSDNGSTTISATVSSDGHYYLKIQERDAAGNWSAVRAREVTLTPVIPLNGQTAVSTILSTKNPIAWRTVTKALEYSITLEYQSSKLLWVAVYTDQTTGSNSVITSGTLPIANANYRWKIKYRNTFGWHNHPDLPSPDGWWTFHSQ